MARHSVAVIPGDDAAPEGVAATMDVLGAMQLPIDWDVLPVGSELAEMDRAEREHYVNDRIDAADTVLFGSTNGTTPGVVHMRWGRLTFANCRPVQWRAGFRSPLAEPDGIDYVIVRENLEDAYIGVQGDLGALRASNLIGPRARMPRGEEGNFAVKVITREGTEQVARFACELARTRKAEGRPGKLTVSAKTNMLPKTDAYFCDIAREVAQEYPDVAYEQFIVDDMAHRLVVHPHDLDVLLLPNLYGDVLSDLGGGTVGGLGLAPSGCYGHDFAYFESAHGTAPDIAGQHRINPTATMLSAVMMLRHLGLHDDAARLDGAITTVYAEGRTLPFDQGGNASTEEFASAVRAALGGN
ncbi:MAG: isocitrate/isopropylmalate family dehydrogenase [Acidimicrobiia bacterium]|nr:isocitrate/isopropylmalate family dehydrogenase [Acidimicrobiia bacterium]